MKKIRVFKFGGSSFPSPESYRVIARYIQRRLREDTDHLVVVVSAMSGTTGRILEAGLGVNPEMSVEVTDSLLGTGEMVAACLMRAALEAEGVSAEHLTGYQLGVTTDSKYTRASVTGVDPGFLLRASERARVVVVAGGQAVNERGKLTMLGRNSSDLSSVIVAAALKTGECEIFSDVPGVYTADPYQVRGARLIESVPYESIIQMSRSGAKVLHHGSVAYARDNGVRIVCRSSGEDGKIGSVIGTGVATGAVTTNAKIVTLAFGSVRARDSAAAFFENEAIIAIPVEGPSQMPCLAVSQENRAWSDVSAQIPELSERVDGLSLLTVIDHDGSVRRSLVSTENALDRAREAHGALYPSVNPSIAPLLSKGRSSLSGMLVDGFRSGSAHAVS